MKRGTRVGQAYVALTVDGDSANKDIVDSVDDAGPGVEKAADRHSKRYSKRFAEALDQLPAKVSKKLDETLGLAGDKAGRDSGDKAAKSFAKSFGKSLAKNLAREMEDVFARQLDLFEQSGGIGGRGGGGGGGTGGTGGGGVSGNSDGVLRPPPAEQRYLQSAYRLNVMFERKRDLIRKAAYKEEARRNKMLTDQYMKDWDAALKERARMEAATQKRIELISRARSKFERDLEAKRVDERGNNIPGRGRAETSLGDRIADSFGRRSRNDFIHGFAVALGGMVKLVTGVQRAATGLFSTFQEGFNGAAEGASFFSKNLSGVASVGGRLVSGLAKGGPAILAVVVALSVMISIVGALIGIVTALAATITTALVGSLIVLSGAIGAVVVAGGLLTAAFMSMTDAQQEALATAFKPLHELMIGIGQTMITQMLPAFKTWSSFLQTALINITPLAEAMGAAFAQAGTNITAALTGPGFQMLASELAFFLPGIIDQLSAAFGEFLNGLAASFAAVLPYVGVFSDYLVRLTERFSTWASSFEGQNSIANFVDRAVVALKSLWGAVREVSGLLFDVLFSPQALAAGNTMFDAIRDKFAEWRDIVAEAAADGSLQRWFDDAIEFGTNLWSVMESLGGTFMALYDSGTIELISEGLSALADIIDFLNMVLEPLASLLGGNLPNALASALQGLQNLLPGFSAFEEQLAKIQSRLEAMGVATGSIIAPGTGRSLSNMVSKAIRNKDNEDRKGNRKGLIGSGRNALAGTTDEDAPYVNPYKKFAEGLIKDGPTVSAQIRNAMLELVKKIAEGINDAVKSKDIVESRESMLNLATDLKTDAEKMVNTAQQALNSAAQSLAGAGSANAAESALKKVKAAQKDLEAALANQKRINGVAKTLLRQRVTSEYHVQRLLAGLTSRNATLGDYVVARGRVTKQLELANEKLVDALALRDDYRTAITESTRAFGALTTAQAKVLGGIEQALTSTDITTNLEDRLAKIRKFQDNLRILSSQGLSDAAYKQILDAGVEDGGRFAQALVDGGLGSVQQVNGLVSQIDTIANQLGLEASSRLYQAGVDAAKGLVDGLTSMSKQLDSAAAKLGAAIARAVKKALGIKSPSTVMIAAMGYVGDGLEIGLDRQHSKVETAASRLSDKVSISPRASVSSGEYGNEVSGNSSGDPRFRDLIVHTPTENPEAVAKEVLNEVTGRL